MKLKHVIATLALASTMAVGVGAVLGGVNAKESRAEVLSNKIVLQFDDDSWKSTDSKLAVYFFDSEETPHAAWGELVQGNGQKYLEYSYSLEFVPTGCKVARVSGMAEAAGDWMFDTSNEGLYAISEADIPLHDVVWVGHYNEMQKTTKCGSYTLDTYVKGGASDDWSEATVNTKLEGFQVNASGKLELFGLVEIPADSYFKVTTLCDDAWYNAYTTAHESISSNLSVAEEGNHNIHNVAAAKYDFYFNFDDKTSYISSPDFVKADTFAKEFNAAMTPLCHDDNGFSAEVIAEWGTQKGKFAVLEAGAQKVLKEATSEGEGNIPTFIKKYEFIAAKYGEEHLGAGYNFLAKDLSALTLKTVDNEFNVATIIVPVVATVVLAGLSVVVALYLKRRKNEIQ